MRVKCDKIRLLFGMRFDSWVSREPKFVYNQ